MYIIKNFKEAKYNAKTNEWSRNFSNVPTNKIIEIGFLNHDSQTCDDETQSPVYFATIFLGKAYKKMFVITFLDVLFNSDYKWVLYKDNTVFTDIKISGNDRYPDFWREIDI